MRQQFPALLLSANNAPPIINIFQHRSIIFDNDYVPTARLPEGDQDFFKAKDEIEADPVRGRAAIRSNVFADVARCFLPLDNQRARGFRRMQPYFHGFLPEAGMGGFVGEYPSGRYSKAHYHASGAVLVCLTGKGYTFNWPVAFGPRPWRPGTATRSRSSTTCPAAWSPRRRAAGTGFTSTSASARSRCGCVNFWGGPNGGWGHEEDQDKEEIPAWNIYGIEHGGRSINYKNEDPEIRATTSHGWRRRGFCRRCRRRCSKKTSDEDDLGKGLRGAAAGRFAFARRPRAVLGKGLRGAAAGRFAFARYGRLRLPAAHPRPLVGGGRRLPWPRLAERCAGFYPKGTARFGPCRGVRFERRGRYGSRCTAAGATAAGTSLSS